MKPIIRVQNLSKEYTIGAKAEPYGTFRESIVRAARKPIDLVRGNNGSGKKNSFWALNDVSFDVMPGEVVGIIGRNGAGKSTLLKILSRITEPTTGKVELYGRVGSLLEVGTGFHPELTGRENIYLNGAILGMRRDEIAKKFDEIVDFAEIEDFLDTPVKRYSSGMYVRLAFAVAAHLEPEILIVDEVLAVGDAEFQRKCLGKMKKVAEQGRTVLFVSHNITAIQSLCSKAMLLEKGSVLAFGVTHEVVDLYTNKYFSGVMVREWGPGEEPGNELVRFTRVAVVPDKNRDVVDVATPLQIEFELEWLGNNSAELNLSLVLWTISGECIFNVGSQIGLVARGRIRSVCSIPGNLLNDDKYTCEIYVVRDASEVVFRQADIIHFEVVDLPREGNWYGKWMGAVRPQLGFSLESLK